MKKRIGSLLLILTLCFTLLPTAAFAEGTSVDNWDGSADTRWYADAPDASEYHISTAEQLAGLAKLVNTENESVSFAGKTIYLDNDLDLAGYEWISIGSEVGTNKKNIPWYYRFNGTFDGRGHVIYNLYSHDSLLRNEEYYDGNVATAHGRDVFKTGLFGYLYKGTIKDLGIKNADIWIDPDDVSTYGEGILVDYIEDSTIENCWTTGSITGGSYFEQWIGGVVGSTWGDCKISGCYSSAEIVGNYLGKGYNVPGGAVPMDYFDSLGGIAGGIPLYGTLDISDCWFDGKITVNSIQATVGGIVGYADTATVKKCMVISEDIGRDSVTEEVNTCWVAYARGGTVENCYWPDDEKAYDPSPLESITNGTVTNESQGTPVSNFTSADVLAGLKNNAGAGVEWVAGIGHPTFVWDDNNILADYTAVEAAIARATALDSSLYTNYSAVEDSINSVDRAKSKAQQTEVDAMAKAIEDAVSALQYKGADYTKVDAAIAKANTLNKNSYQDFSAVEKAIAAVVRDKNITQQSEVDAMAKAIEDAIAALVKKPSSGGGSSSPSYSVTTPSKTENGTVTVSPRSAEKGDTVTITAKPDSGYQLDDLTVTDKNGKELKLTDKGNGKYAFTMPAGKVEIKATFAKEVETSPFSDVSTSAYYYEAVKWAQEKGITGGIGNGLFGPNQPCTRAQIVTFLWRAAGSPEPKSMSNFSDISTDSYYAKAVAWAVENGITTGTGDGKFSPDATCTRAQSVTFLFRAIGKLVDSKAEFSDVLTDSYYANAVAWAVENGVTNGIGNGLFGPDNSCTRAQIVTFLYRTYQGK